MDWRVRRLTLNDLDALFHLVEQFATSFKPERGPFEVAVQHIILDESAWLSVADYNGEVAGYCLGFEHYALFANGRVAWVEEIMVKEELRKKGIGKSLMEEFEKWARSRGAKLVALATRRASPFYAALGYEDSATYFRKLL
jgi:GNAT superfamily N-acetyltransferase